MTLFWKTLAFVVSIMLFLLFLAWNFLGPVSNSATQITFIIPQNKADFDLSTSLYNKKLIKNPKAFVLLQDYFFEDMEIQEGGYNLNQKMNSWQVLKKLTSKQDLFWVNIFYCPRKEQVGEKLASILGWDKIKLDEWNNLYKNTEYFEGVYYPDTYLIPVNESVEDIAQRFINRFNEKFGPLENEYLSKNIKWTTGLKIASLIAREAAGKEDMKIVSSVIWNRLNIDMRLQIDATMQYTLGKNENGSWWGAIDLEEKQKDSPYNSYRNEGLPPTPICSPNIDYIEAALNPDEIDCLFYLHDQNRQIHCAKTYEEHKANIKAYL